MVEVVLDTGQRLQSVDLLEYEAAATVRDMRSRIRVVAVTIHNLMAGLHEGSDDEQLAVALGG